MRRFSRHAPGPHKGVNFMRKKISYLLLSAGVTVLSLGAAAVAQQGQDRGVAQDQQVEQADPAAADSLSERSFTRPSEERDLAFSTPGLVTKVNVKDGEAVKADQVLAEQDVTVEVANKATFEIEAKSKVEEEYAKADWGQKQVELKRKVQLRAKNNASELEVEEAKLAVDRAFASIELAKQKRQTAAAQAAVEQAKIDLKRIKSPIDGVVQKLDTHAGEVAASAAEKPAIRVVRNDPLWIDVNFPADQAAKLKAGQTLQVRYTTDRNKWMPADVLYLQPVVKFGSQTRTVRLVMPNPDDLPSGLEVYVKLPDAVAAARPGPRAGADR